MEPYDDNGIADSDRLIRRINPDYHLAYDDGLKQYRISSKAFAPSSGLNGGMSVDIEALIVAAGMNPRDFVTTPPHAGSVVFRAGDVRALRLRVGRSPTPENDFHGEVWPEAGNRKFTGQQKRRLHALAEWYVPIPDVAIG